MRMASRTSLRCRWVLPAGALVRASSTEVIAVLPYEPSLGCHAPPRAGQRRGYVFSRSNIVCSCGRFEGPPSWPGPMRGFRPKDRTRLTKCTKGGNRDTVFVLALARDLSGTDLAPSQG